MPRLTGVAGLDSFVGSHGKRSYPVLPSMKRLFALALVAITPSLARAQAPADGGAARVAPTAVAVRTAAAPRIDGRLDDVAWSQAPVISTFTQRDPVEGSPASEATEARI